MQKLGTIDAGGTNTRFAATTLDGRLSGEVKSIRSPQSYPELQKQICESFELHSLVGISICVAGAVSGSNITCAPNIPWLTDFDLKGQLEQDFKIPVEVWNDVVAAAAGEFVARGHLMPTDTLVITGSSGVGGCKVTIVSSGRVQFTPMEIGHIRHNRGAGELCGCGRYSCFEAICSGLAVRKKIRMDYATKFSTEIDPCVALTEAAEDGDNEAIQFLKRWGFDFGIGLAQILNGRREIKEVIYMGSFAMSAMRYAVQSVHDAITANLEEERAIDIAPMISVGSGPHQGCAELFRSVRDPSHRSIILKPGLLPEQILPAQQNAHLTEAVLSVTNIPFKVSEFRKGFKSGTATPNNPLLMTNNTTPGPFWPDGFPTELIKPMHDAALASASAVLGNEDRAMDVAQDVMLRLLKNPDGVRNPVCWAGIAAHNLAINGSKRDRRLTPFEDENGNPVVDVEDDVLSFGIGLQEVREAAPRTTKILDRLIGELKPEDRAILFAKHRDRMTWAQAATVLDLTEQCIRQRWFRLLQNLHADLVYEVRHGEAQERELFLDALCNDRAFEAFLIVTLDWTFDCYLGSQNGPKSYWQA